MDVGPFAAKYLFYNFILPQQRPVRRMSYSKGGRWRGSLKPCHLVKLGLQMRLNKAMRRLRAVASVMTRYELNSRIDVIFLSTHALEMSCL